MINFYILEKIREAQRLAEIEQIKANAIIINKNFVKTPKLYVHNKGTTSVLPPMIYGLEMYFTDNELPDNYSFAILDAGQTERDRLVSNTRYETTKEIFEKIFEVLCCFTTQGKSKEYDEGFIDCLAEADKRLQNLAKEKYSVAVE